MSPIPITGMLMARKRVVISIMNLKSNLFVSWNQSCGSQGLKTVISAADETNVGLAVEGFKRFISDGADTFVGQWNTHTYSGTDVDRARFSQLAHQTGKDLWMSETGEGGNGIGR